MKIARDHSYSTFVKFSKRLIFLNPWYAQVRTCAYLGLRNVSFLKNFGNALNEWSLIGICFRPLSFDVNRIILPFYSQCSKPTFPLLCILTAIQTFVSWFNKIFQGDCLKISLLVLSDFKKINDFLIFLKSKLDKLNSFFNATNLWSDLCTSN